jgi:hypothetical protein
VREREHKKGKKKENRQRKEGRWTRHGVQLTDEKTENHRPTAISLQVAWTRSAQKSSYMYHRSWAGAWRGVRVSYLESPIASFLSLRLGSFSNSELFNIIHRFPRDYPEMHGVSFMACLHLLSWLIEEVTLDPLHPQPFTREIISQTSRPVSKEFIHYDDNYFSHPSACCSRPPAKTLLEQPPAYGSQTAISPPCGVVL